jgi:hypothetical protein
MINCDKSAFVEAFMKCPSYNDFGYTDNGLYALYDYLNSDECQLNIDILSLDVLLIIARTYPEHRNVVLAAIDYGWDGSGLSELEQEFEARKFFLEESEVTVLDFEGGVILVD